MLFENVYNRVYCQLMQEGEQGEVCYNLPELTKIFFEAGVKAALGERTQQPVLLSKETQYSVLLKGKSNES